MKTTVITPRRRSTGQALAEFALVFPILMVLIIAIFDAGRLVFAYNDITNAAREGTRTGIIDQTPATIQNEVMRQATSLGLTAANVQVQFCTADLVTCNATKPTTLDKVVEVTVSYDWQAITPIIGGLIGPKTVTAVSRMPIERVFP
jgi:Flp pilus assembly protein TadG